MSLNTKLAGWHKLASEVESLQSTQAGDARYDQRPDKATLNVRLAWGRQMQATSELRMRTPRAALQSPSDLPNY